MTTPIDFHAAIARLQPPTTPDLAAAYQNLEHQITTLEDQRRRHLVLSAIFLCTGFLPALITPLFLWPDIPFLMMTWLVVTLTATIELIARIRFGRSDAAFIRIGTMIAAWTTGLAAIWFLDTTNHLFGLNGVFIGSLSFGWELTITLALASIALLKSLRTEQQFTRAIATPLETARKAQAELKNLSRDTHPVEYAQLDTWRTRDTRLDAYLNTIANLGRNLVAGEYQAAKTRMDRAQSRFTPYP